MAETFKEPYLTQVKQALDGAVSICWEGCHKIYIARDQESHKQQKSFGYDTVPVDETSLQTLFEWFSTSCGLRFIQAIANSDDFQNVIPQFDYDAETVEKP
jgi:hypothetical protein